MAELTNETWSRIGKLQRRAEADPQFRQRLAADPRRVLEAEGIPTKGLRIESEADPGGSEVVGHAMKNDDGSCICIVGQWPLCIVKVCQSK